LPAVPGSRSGSQDVQLEDIEAVHDLLICLRVNPHRSVNQDVHVETRQDVGCLCSLGLAYARHRI
jgi:hypothetical protein